MTAVSPTTKSWPKVMSWVLTLADAAEAKRRQDRRAAANGVVIHFMGARFLSSLNIFH